MADELQLQVNGKMWSITAPDTPLLYVLTDDLALQGPRFGCGLGQCGCCSVLADGVEIRSCITPTSKVVGTLLYASKHWTGISLPRALPHTPCRSTTALHAESEVGLVAPQRAAPPGLRLT